MSWIATEDCMIIGTVHRPGANNGPIIYLDGVPIFIGAIGADNGTIYYLPFWFFIKKGQTLSTSPTGVYNGLKIYGLC